MKILPAISVSPPRVKIDVATISFATSSLLVNSVAVAGQYGYANTHFGWVWQMNLAYAATVESVAVSFAAYAHAAQIKNDSAFRTKAASYGIGLLVGALNYSHYAAGWAHPTAKAVSLGVLSALSPVLWGLFSRRSSRDILLDKDLIEPHAVRLGPTRWFFHPALSFLVARYAAWRGIRDPKQALAEYAAYRRQAGKPIKWDGIQDETLNVQQDGQQDEVRDERQDEAQDETQDETQDGSRDDRRDGSRDEVWDDARDGQQDEAWDETQDGVRDEGQDGVRDGQQDEVQDSTRDEAQDRPRRRFPRKGGRVRDVGPLLEQTRALLSENPALSRDELRPILGCSNGTTSAVLRQVRNEMAEAETQEPAV